MFRTITGAVKATTDGAKFGFITFIAFSICAFAFGCIKFAFKLMVNTLSKTVR